MVTAIDRVFAGMADEEPPGRQTPPTAFCGGARVSPL